MAYKKKYLLIRLQVGGVAQWLEVRTGWQTYLIHA